VWPAVLKYSGEDELLLIKDESTWLADDDLSAYVYDDDLSAYVYDDDLSAYVYDENDMLIDSNGALYALNYHVKTRQIHVNPQKKQCLLINLRGGLKII
jgi:hypothetical protein